MCGINGITSPDQHSRVEAMNEITKRRGPDGRDIFSNDHITFGHNLLAIHDSVENSKQPYILDDFVLVFNGAIYNYKELNEWECTTDTDTEVLARGLKQYGVSFLERCEGMWAIAFWDGNCTTVCRDHFGIKPLFYRVNEEGELLFSSSVHALELPENKLELFAFAMFRQFGYVPGYLTLLQKAFKLTPGEYFSFKDGKIFDKGTLWKDKFNATKTFDIEEFNSNLNEAITKARTGIRQRGIFLSGGLDSTSVAHYLGDKRTFTSRYIPQSADFNDDADIALRMAEDYDFNHQEIEITPDNLYECLDECIDALELPVFNKSTPSYLYINRALREAGTIVTYSGDGGDEMYTGYVTHGRYQNTGNPIADHYNAIAWKMSKRMKVVDSRYEIGVNEYVQYMEGWFPKSCFGDDHLNNCLFVEMLTRVSEDFLTRNDKFGSYYGMEGRFPLLNQKYYRYIMSIPSDVKMTNLDTNKYQPGEYKFLAREGLKDVLPDYVISKPKTGWSIPDNEWRKTQDEFRQKMIKIINTPLGNNIDNIVNWAREDGVKTFYSAAYFKKWAMKYGVTL